MAVAERLEGDAARELAALVHRAARAQQLAGMGDYDWHVATDDNRWSDQLYRIYGYEPQSVPMTYERFVAHLHPDDRERVLAVHRHSFATGEPYEMVERIVRPDGEVRHLASNGEVELDADGRPVRVRGTCVDITEQVLAEHERERAAEHLGESRERQRQAAELHDRVVQGLTASLLALDLDDPARARDLIERTLGATTQMLTELVAPLGDEEAAVGDLVRGSAADLDARA